MVIVFHCSKRIDEENATKEKRRGLAAFECGACGCVGKASNACICGAGGWACVGATKVGE